MAGNMVPYSNPAGNNQTTPGAGMAAPTTTTSPLPGANPVLAPATGAATTNPLVPATAGAVPTAPIVPNLSPSNNAEFQNQLGDIYGATGGALSSFMGSISGTDSAALQEYTASLAPQEAKAGANLNASLGAGGVSANSSVAALGNANLQAQDTATIAGESANLTMSQEQLQAQLLQSILPDAEAQTSQDSPLGLIATGLSDAGSLATTLGKLKTL